MSQYARKQPPHLTAGSMVRDGVDSQSINFLAASRLASSDTHSGPNSSTSRCCIPGRSDLPLSGVLWPDFEGGFDPESVGPSCGRRSSSRCGGADATFAPLWEGGVFPDAGGVDPSFPEVAFPESRCPRVSPPRLAPGEIHVPWSESRSRICDVDTVPTWRADTWSNSRLDPAAPDPDCPPQAPSSATVATEPTARLACLTNRPDDTTTLIPQRCSTPGRVPTVTSTVTTHSQWQRYRHAFPTRQGIGWFTRGCLTRRAPPAGRGRRATPADSRR